MGDSTRLDTFFTAKKYQDVSKNLRTLLRMEKMTVFVLSNPTKRHIKENRFLIVSLKKGVQNGTFSDKQRWRKFVFSLQNVKVFLIFLLFIHKIHQRCFASQRNCDCLIHRKTVLMNNVQWLETVIFFLKFLFPLYIFKAKWNTNTIYARLKI